MLYLNIQIAFNRVESNSRLIFNQCLYAKGIMLTTSLHTTTYKFYLHNSTDIQIPLARNDATIQLIEHIGIITREAKNITVIYPLYPLFAL